MKPPQTGGFLFDIGKPRTLVQEHQVGIALYIAK